MTFANAGERIADAAENAPDDVGDNPNQRHAQLRYASHDRPGAWIVDPVTELRRLYRDLDADDASNEGAVVLVDLTTHAPTGGIRVQVVRLRDDRGPGLGRYASHEVVDDVDAALDHVRENVDAPLLDRERVSVREVRD